MKDDTFIEKLRTIFVPWDTFNLRMTPVERIVYGGVGLILLSVAGYIISLAIRKP